MILKHSSSLNDASHPTTAATPLPYKAAKKATGTTPCDSLPEFAHDADTQPETADSNQTAHTPVTTLTMKRPEAILNDRTSPPSPRSEPPNPLG